MYVLLKTHKFDTGDISYRDEILNIWKKRPIVSCCGSPTEKLSYVCTQILSPLLNFVPSHLQNVYKYIESLQALAPEQLQGLQFYTADVVSLYTNIDVGRCVDDIIEFAAERIEHLDLWGSSLTEVHIILDLVLSGSFFTFNNRLDQQLVGLFMGCRPSPLAAVIRVFSFESRSIYTDTYYLSNPVHLFFGRYYIDDLSSLSRTREVALETLNRISDMLPDGLLKWELDFPESCRHFVPFLSTQIRIDEEGILHHKYYRKSQKKDITINSYSHHPFKTKLLTARNFYTTAKACSSNDIYTEESYKIIDRLLARNDFKNPRQYVQYRSPKIERRNTITRKMMLNMFLYVYRIFQRICLIKSDILLLIIIYLFVLFLPQAKNLKTFFAFLGRTIRNIVLALEALFVPVFAKAVTVK